MVGYRTEKKGDASASPRMGEREKKGRAFATGRTEFSVALRPFDQEERRKKRRGPRKGENNVLPFERVLIRHHRNR